MTHLPLKKEIETSKVLKKAISANRALANLNGVVRIIPNRAILINSLVLQEAKDSSEIENIITTHDELYRANLDIESVTNEAKEVQNYKEALLGGFALVKDTKLLLKKHIIEIQGVLEKNDAGVRRQAGTNLKNALTGEVIYTPPQDYDEIQNLLTNLESYINEPNELDPLVNRELPKPYSKDLVEILFMHPYTKIDFLVDRLHTTRQTASKYLIELENIGILKNIQIKNSKYYINIELFAMLKKGI